ncbi:MAG TPA: hypothetical protein DCM05_16350 [Elusimicrobia bacterium]|nr:hypothetical protein [Elusimicrobiota bacterium]
MALHIFGDESGQVGGGHFLIGLLFIDSKSVAGYEKQLRELKVSQGFLESELHYNALSPHKVVLAKSIIDWYFGATEAVFKCTVVPAAAFDVRKYRDNLRFISADEMSYNIIYKSAIVYHLETEERDLNKVLIVDRKDKARPDEFKDFLCTNIPSVADMQEADSRDHNLLQVVDLLVGCVNGDINGVQKFAKRTVIDHLKVRLGVTDFRQRNAYTKEKFRVAFWLGKKL